MSAALRAGAKLSGCTVHIADDQYDHGPVVLQEAVALPDGADAATIAERVFEAEKRALPEALRLLIEGRAGWNDGELNWS